EVFRLDRPLPAGLAADGAPELAALERDPAAAEPLPQRAPGVHRLADEAEPLELAQDVAEQRRAAPAGAGDVDDLEGSAHRGGPLIEARQAPAWCQGAARRMLGAGQRRRIDPRVADGEDLPEVTVGILPVEVLAAEAPVDLHVGLAERGAAVRDARRLDAAEDRVELGVAHVEAVVVALEL